MNKQISLLYLSNELAQAQAKKKEFLSRIEQIIPWGKWRGNKPTLDLMVVHLHVLQNLYDLSDEVTAAEVIDSRAFSSNQVPDGDTIGRSADRTQIDSEKETIVDSLVNTLKKYQKEQGQRIRRTRVRNEDSVSTRPRIS